MIKAQHHWFFVRFLDCYTRFMLNRHFRNVIFEGDLKELKQAAILIGNHFSWWDGFIAMYLNKRIIGKKFHAMMLEEQLTQRMFLSKAGAFSIQPGSRSVVESIAYTKKMLQDKNNLLTMYPQGKFSSISNPQFDFEKGIERIVVQSPEARVHFYVALIDYFEHAKPTLYVYLKSAKGEFRNASLSDQYRQFYQEAVNEQSKKAQ